jgi:hypothetical protein
MKGGCAMSIAIVPVAPGHADELHPHRSLA